MPSEPKYMRVEGLRESVKSASHQITAWPPNEAAAPPPALRGQPMPSKGRPGHSQRLVCPALAALVPPLGTAPSPCFRPR
jgi:hypothetical protein